MSYELTTDDLKDACAVSPQLRRMRAHRIRYLIVAGIPVLLITTVAAGLTSRYGLAFHTWSRPFMFGLALPVWGALAEVAIRLWRLSPEWIARATLRTNPQLNGRHREEISPDGVTTIEPNGTTLFIPWAAIAGIHESERAFHLLGIDGALKATLPKRGLDHPDLIPALHEFLDDSINVQSQPPTTSPNTTQT